MWLDLRFALRIFHRRPGFACVAALTLALGIGAATAVFSIVDAVLLQPLPYRDPSRLAAVWLTSTREPGLAKIFATEADYLEFRRHSRTLAGVSAATWATRTGRVLTGRGPAREVLTIPASASFFDTLGVSAALGRTFTAADETRACSLVLTRQFWTAALAADPSLIGQSIVLDNQPCTVLGVMPEQFRFYPIQTQAWILLGPGFQPDPPHLLVGIFARLKPGVTLAQAQAELRGLYRAMHPSGEQRDFEPVVYDLHGEFTFLAGRTLRATLLVVFAAVLLVLLIACLNVAHLLLARLSERGREMAVRAALGSGQRRLVRQVLTESLLLAYAGTALGVALAFAAVRCFRYRNPIELTAGADVRVSLPVLAFSALLAIATTVVFGLLPALRASRVDLNRHLKAAGRGAIAGRRRLGQAAIAVEMGLSFVLLAAAGMLMTSALRMGSEPLGFNPDGVLATRISPPVYRYSTPAQRLALYDRLLDRLERLPDAAGAALASKLPPEAGGNQVLELPGRPVPAGSQRHDVGADAVSPAFFDVLRLPLRRGRTFDARDRENTAPVAIVNDALAREYFPGLDPIGRQIRLSGGSMPWLTVVGVCGNLKHTELMNEMQWVETPIFYRPLAQEPRPFVQAAVRLRGASGAPARQIHRLIQAADPGIPVGDTEPLAARIAKLLAYPRFRAEVLALFAIAALLLSAVGLHGVLSQLVAQRTPEFGVRRAVGAQTSDLLALVARQGLAPVLAGLAAGIWATLAFDRLLSSLLYRTRAAYPANLTILALLLLAVASVAILLPARRAARIDPLSALRDE